jgi:heme-degrading monooxygenase HmoA
MFAVIYQWRIVPGREEQFAAGWLRCSTQIKKRFGSYGSRLHRTDEGLYVSYGRWPSAEAREPYRAQLDFDPESFHMMQGAIATELPEIRMHIIGDLLDEPEA